jgi:hypothetical protein
MCFTSIAPHIYRCTALQILTERALQTATHYWLELRGNMYAEYLTRFREGAGGTDSVAQLGWQQFLLQLLAAAPEEVIVTKVHYGSHFNDVKVQLCKPQQAKLESPDVVDCYCSAGRPCDSAYG